MRSITPFGLYLIVFLIFGLLGHGALQPNKEILHHHYSRFGLTQAEYSELPAFPSTYEMSYGWFPWKFDLSQEGQAEAYATISVYNVTFNNGVVRELANVLYKVSDQTQPLVDSECTCSAVAVSAKLAWNFTTDFAANWASSSSVLFGLVTMSQSASMKTLQGLSGSVGGGLGLCACECQTFATTNKAEILLEASSDLITLVENYVCPNPKYTDNINNWWNLLTQYVGPAYLGRTQYGGTALMLWITFQALLNTKSEEWLQAQAEGSLANVFAAAGGASVGAKAATSEFRTGTVNVTKFTGGTSCIPPECNVDSWSKSLFQMPIITKVLEMRSNSGLIKSVPCARDSEADEAIANVTAVQILTEVVDKALEGAEQALGAYTLPAGCGTEGTADCYSWYQNRSCCSIHYSRPFPLESELKSAIAKKVAPIKALRGQIALVATARFVSPIYFASLIYQAEPLVLEALNGTANATCQVNYAQSPYRQQSGCPAAGSCNPVGPQTCWAGNSPNRHVSPNGMCCYTDYDCFGCCKNLWDNSCKELNDGRWMCPLICPNLSGVRLSQTATWSKALGL